MGLVGGSKTEEDADLSFLAGEYPDEIADLGNGDTTSLDRKDDLLDCRTRRRGSRDGRRCRVGTLLLLGGARAHLAQRPPLELVFVFAGQVSSSGIVRGFADYFVGGYDSGPKASERRFLMRPMAR